MLTLGKSILKRETFKLRTRGILFDNKSCQRSVDYVCTENFMVHRQCYGDKYKHSCSRFLLNSAQCMESQLINIKPKKLQIIIYSMLYAWCVRYVLLSFVEQLGFNSSTRLIGGQNSYFTTHIRNSIKICSLHFIIFC